MNAKSYDEAEMISGEQCYHTHLSQSAKTAASMSRDMKSGLLSSRHARAAAC